LQGVEDNKKFFKGLSSLVSVVVDKPTEKRKNIVKQSFVGPDFRL